MIGVRFGAGGIHGFSYVDGAKRCSTCGYWTKKNMKKCPCCGSKLATRPWASKSNRKFKEKVGIKYID